jgi:hypothetical protein
MLEVYAIASPMSFVRPDAIYWLRRLAISLEGDDGWWSLRAMKLFSLTAFLAAGRRDLLACVPLVPVSWELIKKSVNLFRTED